MPAKQFKYWSITVPEHSFFPGPMPEAISYVKGQLEVGITNGYRHWQLMVITKCRITLTGCKAYFDRAAHLEPSRSDALEAYVWKEDTGVAGTRFECGEKPFHRNSSTDWAKVRQDAQEGNIEKVPADIYVRYFSNLKRIKLDHQKPSHRGAVVVKLYLGPSGTGKSFSAWEHLGTQATYSKIPTTKWWDGYQGEKKIIIDEFRGTVSIALLLRWLDPAGYPLTLETKGGGAVAQFNEVILTSNVHPRQWYPELDEATILALLRRIEIVEFNTVYQT